MFNQLIEISKDGNVFLQDHSIALMPKLWAVYKDKYMGSDMVRWIVAVEDYKSPYRNLPDTEREKMVTMAIYGKTEYSKCREQIVLDAREEYMTLQYDPQIALYHTMSEKLHQMNLQLRETKISKDTFDDFNDLMVKIEKSVQSRNRVKEAIIKDQEGEKQIRGAKNSGMSLLEERDRIDS